MSYNSILASAPLTSTNYILKANGTTIGNSLIWDNGTNVGIGNTNTSYTLDVSGTVRGTTSAYFATTSGGVGIGGTSLTAGIPLSINVATSNNCNIAFQENSSDKWYLRNITSSNAFSFYSVSGSTEVMRLTSAGNVGIGTSSPASKLDISGGITLSGNGTQANNTLFTLSNGYMYLDGNTNGLILENNSSSSTRIRLEAADNMQFQTASTERMRITSNGNLNVGATAEYNSGVIVGSQSTNNWTIYGRNTASTGTIYVYLAEFINQSPNNSGNYFYYGGDQTSQRFSVRSNGGIYNYSANNVNLSDASTKKDIIPCESYWDKFKAIEIVKFKYKDQSHDDYNIGVIAQQLEEIAPEFIDIDDWSKTGEETKIMKAVYTEDLHHATIKVLQEAMTKIEEQQIQIQSLQEQINILAK